MNDGQADLLIEIRIGSTGELLQSFDRRELDTVLVRLHADRSDGQLVAEEQFGWFASRSRRPRHGDPLPLATMAEPCGVRTLAIQLLDAADVPYTEVFVGGGLTAVAAAVMAGLGVAALAPRMVPTDAVEVGTQLGLPPLPKLPVLLHTRVTGGQERDAGRPHGRIRAGGAGSGRAGHCRQLDRLITGAGWPQRRPTARRRSETAATSKRPMLSMQIFHSP